MSSQDKEKNVNRLEKMCLKTPAVLILIIIGVLDMLFFIPAASFILVEKIGNETWSEENAPTSVAIKIVSVSATAIGIFSIMLLKLCVYPQTAWSVTLRVFTAVLLGFVYYQIDKSLLVLWLFIMMFSVIQIVQELISILCSKKMKKIEDSIATILMKTVIPAIAFTGFAAIIAIAVLVPHFAPEGFQYIYFVLYTFGLEMTTAASCFITILQMAKEEAPDTESNKELKELIKLEKIVEKVGKTTFLSQFTK